MNPGRLFVLHGVIAVGYAAAFLAATGPLLDVYGITPNPEAVYMARWFGVGLLANGLTTLLARDAAESDAVQAIALALAVAYSVGVVLALWGTLLGPFNALGWVAVGFNLLLGSGFGYVRLSRSRGAVASKDPPDRSMERATWTGRGPHHPPAPVTSRVSARMEAER